MGSPEFLDWKERNIRGPWRDEALLQYARDPGYFILVLLE
jgi:hypothetical protein